ncbi:hypothetical protein P4200_24535 [Pseudomonas aeruginosa]|nr:hypothetical protein [Pseudomonas aeruginosa]
MAKALISVLLFSSPSPAAPATTTPLARTAATRSGNWRWKTWPGAACRSRNTRPSVRRFSRKKPQTAVSQSNAALRSTAI